jgi:hypothetical protein
MSTLIDRSGRVASPGTRARPGTQLPPRSPVAAGALAALQSAAASLAVILVPVVLAWATASYSQAPWGDAVRVGIAAWLLAHHTGIVIPGGHVGLMPIGLAIIPMVSCWLAGVKLARGLDPNAETIRAGIGRARPRMPPQRALLALVVTYAGVVTLIGALTTTSKVRPLVGQAFIGSVLICGIAGVTGAAAYRRGSLMRGLRLIVNKLQLPPILRRALRPAVAAISVQLAGSTVLFLVAFVAGWDRVLMLHRALAPGIFGSLVLVLGQLTVVPNLVIWSGAYLAGPGFAVGTGTAVLPGHTDLGAVPALPILGALPSPGNGPSWIWALLALPVIAGAAAGIRIYHSSRPSDPATDVLLIAVVTAMLAGTAWAVMGWLSGGPAGPGRLARMGPIGWEVGLMVAVEVGVGALLAAGIGLAARSLQRSRRVLEVAP